MYIYIVMEMKQSHWPVTGSQPGPSLTFSIDLFPVGPVIDSLGPNDGHLAFLWPKSASWPGSIPEQFLDYPGSILKFHPDHFRFHNCPSLQVYHFMDSTPIYVLEKLLIFMKNLPENSCLLRGFPPSSAKESLIPNRPAGPQWSRPWVFSGCLADRPDSKLWGWCWGIHLDRCRGAKSHHHPNPQAGCRTWKKMGEPAVIFLGGKLMAWWKRKLTPIFHGFYHERLGFLYILL